VKFFGKLPTTVHDQTDPRKYAVDAYQHAGIYPDQPHIVLMSIIVHGEFSERK
jgi:hypothetical protein